MMGYISRPRQARALRTQRRTPILLPAAREVALYPQASFEQSRQRSCLYRLRHACRRRQPCQSLNATTASQAALVGRLVSRKLLGSTLHVGQPCDFVAVAVVWHACPWKSGLFVPLHSDVHPASYHEAKRWHHADIQATPCIPSMRPAGPPALCWYALRASS